MALCGFCPHHLLSADWPLPTFSQTVPHPSCPPSSLPLFLPALSPSQQLLLPFLFCLILPNKDLNWEPLHRACKTPSAHSDWEPFPFPYHTSILSLWTASSLGRTLFLCFSVPGVIGSFSSLAARPGHTFHSVVPICNPRTCTLLGQDCRGTELVVTTQGNYQLRVTVPSFGLILMDISLQLHFHWVFFTLMNLQTAG